MRILVADDEVGMTRALEALLKREHYSVDVVNNGQDALDYGLAENYDALVLDIMMPKMDGLQVLTELRRQGVSTPVLLLTAKSQIEDRVTGLTSGADDYLPKPFDPREFVARVGALTRRGGAYTPSVLSVGNITLNRASFELSCGTSSVRLSSKEFQMLELLMRRKGQLISTEQFMERVWGYDSDTEMNVVWAYISYLRRKLETVGANVSIVARRGQGYLLEETEK
jgi:two-component system, OmpR family, response regulator ArlR